MKFEDAKIEMAKFGKPTKEKWEDMFDRLFVIRGRHSGAPMLRGSVKEVKDFIQSLVEEK